MTTRDGEEALTLSFDTEGQTVKSQPAKRRGVGFLSRGSITYDRRGRAGVGVVVVVKAV
uniref:Uncharacterized protein n=1 Tax=Peronospora matthiolae TaxID=2874970 RepID=A0AAV1U8P0_9STRA